MRIHDELFRYLRLHKATRQLSASKRRDNTRTVIRPTMNASFDPSLAKIEMQSVYKVGWEYILGGKSRNFHLHLPDRLGAKQQLATTVYHRIYSIQLIIYESTRPRIVTLVTFKLQLHTH